MSASRNSYKKAMITTTKAPICGSHAVEVGVSKVKLKNPFERSVAFTHTQYLAFPSAKNACIGNILRHGAAIPTHPTRTQITTMCLFFMCIVTTLLNVMRMIAENRRVKCQTILAA